jgi:hypothetical protein
LINFDEADGARLEARAETMGVKPYAALVFAAVNAYSVALNKSSKCLVQQASLQTRHYEPNSIGNSSGLAGHSPVHRIPNDRYTLECAAGL